MQALTTRQGTILGMGLGVAMIAITALSMAPRAQAENAGLGRGSIDRATQTSALPTNDDYRFQPVMLFGGSGGVPCPEDLNGSGSVDLVDLLQVLSAWGTCPGCVEDIDNSGTVDLSDLLLLLTAWGPCP